MVMIHARSMLVSRWTLTIAVPIRDDFKRVLINRLGTKWYQLATQMGLPKTPVDQIKEMADADLESRITTFLDDYPFPGFRTDTETAQFLLEALQRTSLSAILKDVKRDLEVVVNIQGTHPVSPPCCLPFHKQKHFMLFCFTLLGGHQSAALYVPKQVRFLTWSTV